MLNPQVVEAAELTRNLLIDWIPVLEDTHIAYDLDIPDGPLRVRLDTDAYGRILNNLVQNVVGPQPGHCDLHFAVPAGPGDGAPGVGQRHRHRQAGPAPYL